MAPGQYQDLAITLLAPVVTALLGVIGVAIGDWRQRRTEAGRRALALEHANRQIAFATRWLEARKLVADSPEAVQEAAARATAWLEDAYAIVAASEPPPGDLGPAITPRRLLLLFPLHRPAARVIRGAFHTCLGLVPLWVGFVLHSSLAPGEYLPVDVMLTIGLVVAAMGLRILALRVDGASPGGPERRWPPLSRVLLLQRLERPAAKLVRLAFYAWSCFVAVWAAGTIALDRTQPRLLPGDIVWFIGFVWYAAALRYWAASLEARGKDRGVRPLAAPAPSVGPSPFPPREGAPEPDRTAQST